MLKEIKESIIQGSYKNAVKLIEEALIKGHKPENILNDSLIPAMVEVGTRFEKNVIFIPEMMLAAKAMTAGLDILAPLLSIAKVEPIGTLVIGTVKGDFHDIGKNIVSIMMRGNGFRVIDLGVDVSPEQFVEAIKSTKVEILGMSALLTTTMIHMKSTIDMIVREGLRNSIKIMVGGAPITEDFALKIGSDYYGPNAAVASRIAREILLNS